MAEGVTLPPQIEWLPDDAAIAANGRKFSVPQGGRVAKLPIAREGGAIDGRGVSESLLQTAYRDQKLLMKQDGATVVYRKGHTKKGGLLGNEETEEARFGTVIDLDMRGDEMWGTFVLTAKGYNALMSQEYPGISWAPSPLPTLKNKDILSTGIDHVAALGSSPAALSEYTTLAMESALMTTVAFAKENRMTATDEKQPNAFVRWLRQGMGFAAGDVPVDIEKKEEMPNMAEVAPPPSSPPAMEAGGMEGLVKECLARLGKMEDFLMKGYGKASMAADPEDEEKKAEDGQMSAKKTQREPLDPRLQRLVEQNEQLQRMYVTDQFARLVQSGNLRPDQRETFERRVAQLGPDEAIRDAELMRAGRPPDGLSIPGMDRGVQFATSQVVQKATGGISSEEQADAVLRQLQFNAIMDSGRDNRMTPAPEQGKE